MLAKLVSSTISKAAIREFLGLSKNIKESKEQLVEKLLALLETDNIAKAKFEEIFKHELAVGPGEFETLLQCTPVERKRWVREGKIPILEYRSFRKAGQSLEYPVHDRRVILSISQEEISQWREAYQAAMQEHRRAGAKVAAKSRKANQLSRQDFLFSWEETVTAWKQSGSAELAAVLQLSYWTVWASRWAKENHMKCLRSTKHCALYAARREEWYKRKNEAMQVLAQTPYAKLSFYCPEDAHKMSLHLCNEHYEMMKDDFYVDKWDFYASNAREVRKCPQCFFNKELDYYSLYHLEITAAEFPEIRFSFHMPYPIGKTFFPRPKTLPKVDHVEQDGLFRFGRQLFTQEKVTHREKDVLASFEQALAETKWICGVDSIHEVVETDECHRSDEL